ncbi:hypothetical protein [Pendulispora albinea]|uniref:Uncharacterized protein n=1 Tax=Pendulispora albinea TaxID=2741071 RepID=A0ABZ2LLS8_9BACT
MIPISRTRLLVDASYVTARAAISLPFPHDVDLAPQLIAVALSQAALAATHRALDSAHPILAATSRPDWPPSALTDTEHLATLVLDAGNELAELLSDYAASVARDNLEPDDDSLPF